MGMRQLIKRALIGTGLLRPALIFARRTISPEKQVEYQAKLRFYSRFVRPGDHCFDLGCNVGRMSEPLLDVGAKVIAVDPQKNCLAETRARVGGGRPIEFVCQAVGSKPGTATLFVAPSSVVSSLKSGWFDEHTATIKVPFTTVDDLIQRYGVPHYIKIDVEGFETEVLRGLTKRVNCISFEYHTGHALEPMTSALENLQLIRALQGRSVVNVNIADEPEFLFPDWVKLDDFIEIFKNDLWKRPSNFGDILVVAEDFAATLKGPAPMATR